MRTSAPPPSLTGWCATEGRADGPLPAGVPNWWRRSWLRLYDMPQARTCTLGRDLDVARHQRGPDPEPDPDVHPRWYLTR